MEEKRDRDIRDAIREDTSRGRRPVDTEALRRYQRIKNDFMTLIRAGDLDGVIAALRASGWTEDEIGELVALWRRLLPESTT